MKVYKRVLLRVISNSLIILELLLKYLNLKWNTFEALLSLMFPNNLLILNLSSRFHIRLQLKQGLQTCLTNLITLMQLVKCPLLMLNKSPISQHYRDLQLQRSIILMLICLHIRELLTPILLILNS